MHYLPLSAGFALLFFFRTSDPFNRSLCCRSRRRRAFHARFATNIRSGRILPPTGSEPANAIPHHGKKRQCPERRVIFDDYENSFGGDSEPLKNKKHEPLVLTVQRTEDGQPQPSVQSIIKQRYADEQPSTPAPQISVRKRFSDPEPDTITPKTTIYDDLDSISEVRIVGKKPGVQPPAPKQPSPQESVRAVSQPAPQHNLRPTTPRTTTPQPAHTFSAAPVGHTPTTGNYPQQLCCRRSGCRPRNRRRRY